MMPVQDHRQRYPKGKPRQERKVPFDDYDDIDPNAREFLEHDQYLICCYKVWAFVLKTREWSE